MNDSTFDLNRCSARRYDAQSTAARLASSLPPMSGSFFSPTPEPARPSSPDIRGYLNSLLDGFAADGLSSRDLAVAAETDQVAMVRLNGEVLASSNPEVPVARQLSKPMALKRDFYLGQS